MGTRTAERLAPGWWCTPENLAKARRDGRVWHPGDPITRTGTATAPRRETKGAAAVAEAPPLGPGTFLDRVAVKTRSYGARVPVGREPARLQEFSDGSGLYLLGSSGSEPSPGPAADAGTKTVRELAADGYPVRCVGVIIVDGQQRGTGALVGPATVLTAGHVLSDKGEIADDIAFCAAARPAEGRGVIADVQKARMLAAWAPGGVADDLALLTLGEPVGYELGWFGLASLGPDVLKATRHWVAGYSGSAGPFVSTAGSTMAGASDRLSISFDEARDGESGSPIWIRDDSEGARFAVGVLSSTVVCDEDERGTVYTCLDADRLRAIRSWMDDDART